MPEDNEGLIEPSEARLFALNLKSIAKRERNTGNAELSAVIDEAALMIDRLAALRTAAPQVNEAWREIETAPKDGTPILAIWQWNEGDPNCGAATHEVVRWCGWWDSNGFTQPEPSHWMPLPAPPAAPQDYCGIEQGNEEGAGDDRT